MIAPCGCWAKTSPTLPTCIQQRTYVLYRRKNHAEYVVCTYYFKVSLNFNVELKVNNLTPRQLAAMKSIPVHGVTRLHDLRIQLCTWLGHPVRIPIGL